ncbi:MAG: DUF465 domain-containing protein [Rickettsiales bacterium]|nr:DUF465 domain-containing protein [Rickettsiales bacterium]|tara:strand:- start:311 stop:481 length:171 start_codon:yes stop_codon:yes gene_type:complete
MTLIDRLHLLENRKTAIEEELREEEKHCYHDELAISHLKKEKLFLKDEMGRIRNMA